VKICAAGQRCRPVSWTCLRPHSLPVRWSDSRRLRDGHPTQPPSIRWPEADFLARLDLDGLVRRPVSSHPGGAFLNRQNPQAEQTDFVALLDMNVASVTRSPSTAS
jgi:hypothetical protein